MPELYEAERGFSRLAAMTTPRGGFSATLLADGRVQARRRVPSRGAVLVVGGSNARDFFGRYGSAELHDPRLGRFVRLGSMAEARFKLPDAVVRLPSGRCSSQAAAGRWSSTSPPGVVSGAPGRPVPRFSTATVLQDGRVLVAGGYDDRIAVTSRAWIIRPAEIAANAPMTC